jgi:hypothetical protein
MNLSERILEVSRALEESAEIIVESKISDEALIALYVLKTHKIKPGNAELKMLEKLGYIKGNTLTKAGEDYLKDKAVQKKIKAFMS